MKQKGNFQQKITDLILGGGEKPLPQDDKPAEKPILKVSAPEPVPTLELVHEGKLLFKGKFNHYSIRGNLPMDLAVLPLTISVGEPITDKRLRIKLDLYEHSHVQSAIKQIGEKFFVNPQLVEADIVVLTDLVETYRDELVQTQQAINPRSAKPAENIKPPKEREAIEFLSEPGLMDRTGQLLQQARVLEQQATILYLTGASYKSDMPLHIEVTGNGDNIRNLLQAVSGILPQEDVILLSNVSARSLYHCTGGELMDKMLIFPVGLDNKASKALTDLQQEGSLSTATTIKDRLGNLVSAMKQVKSHFSTLMNGKGIDNKLMWKIAIAESEQVMRQQVKSGNRILSGSIDEAERQKAVMLLQNIVRSLNRIQIINPFADEIDLPVEPEELFYVNNLFQSIVMAVCLYHQYQRQRDDKGRLIVQTEDLRIASDLLFDTIGQDELEPQLRRFYNKTVTYAKTKSPEQPGSYDFTMQELTRALGISKTSCFEYLQQLRELEYIGRTGHANRGYKYRIIDFEPEEPKNNLRKLEMQKQIEKSGVRRPEVCTGSDHPKPSNLNKNEHL